MENQHLGHRHRGHGDWGGGRAAMLPSPHMMGGAGGANGPSGPGEDPMGPPGRGLPMESNNTNHGNEFSPGLHQGGGGPRFPLPRRMMGGDNQGGPQPPHSPRSFSEWNRPPPPPPRHYDYDYGHPNNQPTNNMIHNGWPVMHHNPNQQFYHNGPPQHMHMNFPPPGPPGPGVPHNQQMQHGQHQHQYPPVYQHHPNHHDQFEENRNPPLNNMTRVPCDQDAFGRSFPPQQQQKKRSHETTIRVESDASLAGSGAPFAQPTSDGAQTSKKIRISLNKEAAEKMKALINNGEEGGNDQSAPRCSPLSASSASDETRAKSNKEAAKELRLRMAGENGAGSVNGSVAFAKSKCVESSHNCITTVTADESADASSLTEAQKDRIRRRKEAKLRKKGLVLVLDEASSVEGQLSGRPPRYIVQVRPLIVLDLNGILCHRIRERKLPKQTNFRPSILRVANTDVVPRSDLCDFLWLLFRNFTLAVWTSAAYKTAKTLVYALFPEEIGRKLVFVWSRRQCDLIEKSNIESSRSEIKCDGKSPDAGCHEEGSKGDVEKVSKDDSALSNDGGYKEDSKCKESGSKDDCNMSDAGVKEDLKSDEKGSNDDGNMPQAGCEELGSKCDHNGSTDFFNFQVFYDCLRLFEKSQKDLSHQSAVSAKEGGSTGDKSSRERGKTKGSNRNKNEISMSSNEKRAENKKPSHKDVTAVKPLSKVWSAYPRWNATNTILIDDSPEKCPIQHRGNALHPPPICGTVTCNSNNVIDNDHVNQRTQASFFILLAKHWAEAALLPNEKLMAFFEKHASEHNMGWENGSP